MVREGGDGRDAELAVRREQGHISRREKAVLMVSGAAQRHERLL